MSLNKAMLIGRLGRDPELRYTNNGTAVCNLSLATSRKFKKQDGTSEEKTEWHRIVVWSKQAESCNQYLTKGREVYVEGRIETRKYEHNGVEKYATEIIAENVRFLGGGGGGGDRSGGAKGGGEDGGGNKPESEPVYQPNPADGDIPF